MQTFLRFCSIVLIAITAAKSALFGNLGHATAIFIIFCSLLILVGNRTVFVIAAVLALLILLPRAYAINTQQQTALLGSLLMFTIVCLGLYIMLRGFFKPSNRNRR